jgi:hypothetical protein
MHKHHKYMNSQPVYSCPKYIMAESYNEERAGRRSAASHGGIDLGLVFARYWRKKMTKNEVERERSEVGLLLSGFLDALSAGVQRTFAFGLVHEVFLSLGLCCRRSLVFKA